MKSINEVINSDTKQLNECFYKNLVFGIDGLEIMKPGSIKMNKDTVRMATQGLLNYLVENCDKKELKFAIVYNCRNNSEYVAKITTSRLPSTDISVYLFDNFRSPFAFIKTASNLNV